MSEVFEGYERQYCELSANLSKKCTAASLLDGGKSTILSGFSFIFFRTCRMQMNYDFVRYLSSIFDSIVL